MKGFKSSKKVYELLLVDGQHIAYSSACASDLRTRSGKPTGAIVGCLRRVADMVQRFKPKHCVVLFDKGKNAERVALMQGQYKKSTETDPIKIELSKKFKEELREQVSVLEQALPCLNVYSLGLNDMEADDGAAILSQSSSGHVMVTSADKDWLQLVDDNVDYYNYSSELLVTKDTWDESIPLIEKDERIEVAHSDWLLYRAIVGDTSDKIPGVPGMGKITVGPLVNGFSDIHKLMQSMAAEINVDLAKYASHPIKTQKEKEAVMEEMAEDNKKAKKLAKLFAYREDVKKYIKVMDLRTLYKNERLSESCSVQLARCQPIKDLDLFKELCQENEIYSILKQVNVFSAKFMSLRK